MTDYIVIIAKREREGIHDTPETIVRYCKTYGECLQKCHLGALSFGRNCEAAIYCPSGNAVIGTLGRFSSDWLCGGTIFDEDPEGLNTDSQ